MATAVQSAKVFGVQCLALLLRPTTHPVEDTGGRNELTWGTDWVKCFGRLSPTGCLIPNSVFLRYGGLSEFFGE
jgi:hypothetical protein